MFRKRWKWLREDGWTWFRKNVVKGIILAAVTASLVAGLRGGFDAILRNRLPSGAEVSCVGREPIVDRT